MSDIRALLAAAGLTQLGAARLLHVNGRTMRRWCADGAPEVVRLALRAAIELSERTGEAAGEVLDRLGPGREKS